MAGALASGATEWGSLNLDIAVVALVVVGSWVTVSWWRRADLDDRWPVVAAALAGCLAVGAANREHLAVAAAAVAAALVAARFEPVRSGWVQPTVLMISAVAVYLSVPDTEVAVVVGAALVPTVLRCAVGGGRWSDTATMAWWVGLALAVVDGGWGRQQGLAGIVPLLLPLALVSVARSWVPGARRSAWAVVSVHAVVSLAAARVVSRWAPAAQVAVVALVASVLVAWAVWTRWRPAPDGSGE